MTTRAGVVLAATIALTPLSSPAQSDWVDIKDPSELRALYSNKTLKGKDWMDRAWVGHYRPDGQGILLFEGGRYPRTWEVSGKDQVCVNTQFDRRCFRFQRHKAKGATYRSINVANDQVIEFTAEEGVPKF